MENRLLFVNLPSSLDYGNILLDWHLSEDEFFN